MRLKRNPEPMRSFSFSGFNPDGQMAAFTGAAEYPAFGNYGPYYGPPSSVQDSYGPPPSGAEQPATAVADPKNRHQNSNGDHHRIPQEYVPKPDAPASESKEQYNNSVEQTNDKKHYRGKGAIDLPRSLRIFKRKIKTKNTRRFYTLVQNIGSIEIV